MRQATSHGPHRRVCPVAGSRTAAIVQSQANGAVSSARVASGASGNHKPRPIMGRDLWLPLSGSDLWAASDPPPLIYNLTRSSLLAQPGRTTLPPSEMFDVQTIFFKIFFKKQKITTHLVSFFLNFLTHLRALFVISFSLFL